MAVTTKWEPLSFLETNPPEPYTIIILNQPIAIKKEVMFHLWNKSSYRITVDGGTDQWFQWLEESGFCGLDNGGLPDLVTGDLDSILPDTVSMLKEKSICIKPTPDQDLTDFCKAVTCMRDTSATKLAIAICEIGGRLDHILSQLNTLHKHEENIILLSSISATWLLRPGLHDIIVSALKSNILSPEKWISLIPVGAPTTVTTSGLKWNLNNEEMKFGGLISSSNTYSDEPIIKIKSDQPLIWSMGINLTEK